MGWEFCFIAAKCIFYLFCQKSSLHSFSGYADKKIYQWWFELFSGLTAHFTNINGTLVAFDILVFISKNQHNNGAENSLCFCFWTSAGYDAYKMFKSKHHCSISHNYYCDCDISCKLDAEIQFHPSDLKSECNNRVVCAQVIKMSKSILLVLV